VETKDKHERHVIGARTNLYHGIEDMAKTVDSWKKFDEHGEDYASEDSEEKKELKKKFRKRKKAKDFINLVKSKAEESDEDPFKSEEEYKEVDLPVDGEGTDYNVHYSLYEDYVLTAEEGNNYADDSGGNKNCKTIDGPGKGKPCIFPFIYQEKEYNTCTKDGDDEVHEYWCSTKVDDGVHVSGEWGRCSKRCQGVDYEHFVKQDCDTEEPGVKCFIPFSYMGFMYHGCINSDGEKPWCTPKDPDSKSGFKKANCSESCPTDHILSTVKLSQEEIIATLKTNPKVFSKIEKGEDCYEVLGSHNMTKICLEADYCSPEKRKASEVLQRVCGSNMIMPRRNEVEDRYPQLSDCFFSCGSLDNF